MKSHVEKSPGSPKLSARLNAPPNEVYLVNLLNGREGQTWGSLSHPAYTSTGILCTIRLRRRLFFDFSVYFGNNGVGRGRKHKEYDLIFRIISSDRRMSSMIPHIIESLEEHKITFIRESVNEKK